MLADELAEEGLVYAGAVYNGCVPERAAEFDGFEQDGLGLLVGEIRAESVAEAHCAEAWEGDLYVLELERFSHGMWLACSK